MPALPPSALPPTGELCEQQLFIRLQTQLVLHNAQSCGWAALVSFSQRGGLNHKQSITASAHAAPQRGGGGGIFILR